MKSQISIEFMVGVMIILMIYVATISVFSNYLQTRTVYDERGKQICYTITNAVNSAVIGGDGFFSNLTLPREIGGADYFAFVNPLNTSLITVDWEGGLFSCSMSTQAVSVILFKPSKLTVSNIEDEIYLSTVSTDKRIYEKNSEIEIFGGVFLSDVLIKIYNENGEVVNEIELELSENNITNMPMNNTFIYTWTTDVAGTYIITASDTEYKNLYAERFIYVV